MTTPADLLDLAADVIETRGWCQRAWEDPEGKVCLLGAINVADQLIHNGRLSSVGEEATTAVRRHLNGFTLIWNDWPGRTEFEVIDALRLTAKDLRNEAKP